MRHNKSRVRHRQQQSGAGKGFCFDTSLIYCSSDKVFQALSPWKKQQTAHNASLTWIFRLLLGRYFWVAYETPFLLPDMNIIFCTTFMNHLFVNIEIMVSQTNAPFWDKMRPSSVGLICTSTIDNGREIASFRRICRHAILRLRLYGYANVC